MYEVPVSYEMRGYTEGKKLEYQMHWQLYIVGLNINQKINVKIFKKHFY